MILIKDKVFKLIEDGKYTGLSEAARQLGCSSQAIWYALRALEAEGAIVSQLPFRINNEMN